MKDELCTAYGRDHWVVEKNYNTLSNIAKQKCQKYYSFKAKEVLRKALAEYPIETTEVVTGGHGSSKRQSNRKK